MINVFKELVDMERKLQDLTHEISTLSERGDVVDKLLEDFHKLTEEFKDKKGYTYKSEIKGILKSMAFPESYYDKKINLLSGGERTRLSLAVLLMQKPNVLFLDEPTNHLDIGTLKWLEGYLKNYTGTIVMISHDRYFLDQTVNKIFEIENHKLTVYDGNYSIFSEKKRRNRESALNLFENQQKEVKRQEEIIRRFKQHGTEKLAKRAQSREKRLENIELMEKPETISGNMKIRFKEKFKSGRDVIFAEDLSKGFGSGDSRRELFKNVDLDIKKGERLCLVGANGIGKTTLLKIIMGAVPNDQGHMHLGHNVMLGYYDQEQQLLEDGNTILDEMTTAYRLYSDTEMRSILGRFLFLGDDVFKRISALSGGERARLSLLKLMLSGSNTLLLDEPTNHLDIASKEVFEGALLDFPGTLVVISHDRYFLNKIPTRIIELTENGTENFLGGYDYYVEKKESLSSSKKYLEELRKHADVKGREKDDEGGLDSAEQRKINKAMQTKQKRLEKDKNFLEVEIEKLEEEIRDLEGELCKETIYTDHVLTKEYSDKLNLFKEELAAKYEEWMNLE